MLSCSEQVVNQEVVHVCWSVIAFTICELGLFKGRLSFFFFFIFLFQAEDGIRDLVRSRGLGDVYKRQPFDLPLFITRLRFIIFIFSINIK